MNIFKRLFMTAALILTAVLILGSCTDIAGESPTDSGADERTSGEYASDGSEKEETAALTSGVPSDGTEDNGRQDVHTAGAATFPAQTAAPAAPTAPASTSAAQTPSQKNSVCTVYISCETVLDNMDKLKSGKESFIPSNGVILSDAAVAVVEGDTAFDVLKRACEKHSVRIEYEYTPSFGNYYIEGINQLYEKDCGMYSGWLFKINGEFSGVGCSQVSVAEGDTVEFVYTCDMGQDVGAPF